MHIGQPGRRPTSSTSCSGAVKLAVPMNRFVRVKVFVSPRGCATPKPANVTRRMSDGDLLTRMFPGFTYGAVPRGRVRSPGICDRGHDLDHHLRRQAIGMLVAEQGGRVGAIDVVP